MPLGEGLTWSHPFHVPLAQFEGLLELEGVLLPNLWSLPLPGWDPITFALFSWLLPPLLAPSVLSLLVRGLNFGFSISFAVFLAAASFTNTLSCDETALSLAK